MLEMSKWDFDRLIIAACFAGWSVVELLIWLFHHIHVYIEF